LSAVGDQWPARPLGENYSAEAWGHCMKVWCVVVLQLKMELKSLPGCLLVCNLVVMEWTAGDSVRLFRDFQDFSLRRKNLMNCFLLGGNGKPNVRRFVDKLPTKIMIEKSFENISSALQIKFKLILYRVTDWSPFLY
jgi:hypothetical protein